MNAINSPDDAATKRYEQRSATREIRAKEIVTFGVLGQHDPLADFEATVGRPIQGPRDVRL